MVLPKEKLILIELGFWYDKDQPLGMDPKLILNYPWDNSLKKKFIQYLNEAEVLAEFMLYTWCRITGATMNIGIGEMTDGIYIWPLDLVYYLDRYNIELPEYFTRSVIDRDFKYDEANIKFFKEEIDPWSIDPIDADPNKYIVNSEPWKKWSEEKREIAKQSGLLQTIKPVWMK